MIYRLQLRDGTDLIGTDEHQFREQIIQSARERVGILARTAWLPRTLQSLQRYSTARFYEVCYYRIGEYILGAIYKSNTRTVIKKIKNEINTNQILNPNKRDKRSAIKTRHRKTKP